MVSLSPLGEKIFLDRYSLKNPVQSVPLGAVALYVDPETGQKEVGRVIGTTANEVTLENQQGSAVVFRREEIDHPQETVEQALLRVAKAAAEEDTVLFEAYQQALLQGRFIPAGRILESLGSGQETTACNCFVLPCPKDSRAGILHTLHEVTELMCRGGGVGVNFSSLRPAHSYVAGVNGRSSGSVSWLELFSFMTHLIIQGGSRRGAQMAMLGIWHPDIETFINLKRDNQKATGCNLSVIVSDEFMATVEADGLWSLQFPDTKSEAYDREWDGDLSSWVAKGYPVNVWKVVSARELWRSIMEAAHASAEPGVWFQDTANRARISGKKLIATNPCAEEGLPPYGVCNLGHLNLSAFVRGVAWDSESHAPHFDFDALLWTTRAAVRFLDRVVDVSKYPLQETAHQQVLDRRIGLGTLGLGEALIRLGIQYGSPEALEFCEKVYSTIACTALDESCELAIENTPAPAWDPDQFARSTFGSRIKACDPALFDKITRNGLRNVCLTTQAPTGTVGTMLNTSTGIEPYYLLEWDRRGRLGLHRERARVVEEYRQQHPDGPLPDYFLTSSELTPRAHVDMQAVIQRWTTSSISKTVNLPREATVEDVQAVYEQLYVQGCKGGTVYRDGSRDVQVLEAPKEKAAPAPEKPKRRKIPQVRSSVTASRKTPSGKVHIHLTLDDQLNPLEVFCDSGRSGSEVRALMEAVGRLASLVLRVGDETGPKERLTRIYEQLSGLGGTNSIGMGPNRVSSLVDGVAKAIWDAWESLVPSAEKPVMLGLDICPDCHNSTLQNASGCSSCEACGYSRC